MSRTKEILYTASILFVIIAGLSYTINASSLFNKDYIDNPTDSSNEDAIRVALLLDTSGSMSGLLEQAKSQLWNILNELDGYKIKGESPKILISLYEYGKSAHGSYSGYISQLLPFTTDVDLVSDKLFELRTGGSSEYCGQVLYQSLNELNWGHNDNDLRLVYLAGNESINQGSYPFAGSCRQARNKGITVNTIFCGDKYDGIEMGWKQGAELGNGEYMFINHNDKTVYYDSPYDDEIQTLNSKLNNTYVPMGKKGKVAYENQSRQDINAAKYSKANVADRAAYKVSKNYKTESWDLVDAYEKDTSVILEKEQLPSEYLGLSEEEISIKIVEKKEERESLKKQIKALKVKRDKHVETLKSKDESKPTDLQTSIKKSVEKVAKEKDYKKN